MRQEGWTQVDELIPTWDDHDPEPHERTAPDRRRESLRRRNEKRNDAAFPQAAPSARLAGFAKKTRWRKIGAVEANRAPEIAREETRLT
jgi:hypothetical protein